MTDSVDVYTGMDQAYAAIRDKLVAKGMNVDLAKNEAWYLLGSLVESLLQTLDED
jgi:hypothetical protein